MGMRTNEVVDAWGERVLKLERENARLKALLKKLINTLERFKNPSSVAWVRKTASVAVDLIRDPRHGGGE